MRIVFEHFSFVFVSANVMKIIMPLQKNKLVLWWQAHCSLKTMNWNGTSHFMFSVLPNLELKWKTCHLKHFVICKDPVHLLRDVGLQKTSDHFAVIGRGQKFPNVMQQRTNDCFFIRPVFHGSGVSRVQNCLKVSKNQGNLSNSKEFLQKKKTTTKEEVIPLQHQTSGKTGAWWWSQTSLWVFLAEILNFDNLRFFFSQNNQIPILKGVAKSMHPLHTDFLKAKCQSKSILVPRRRLKSVLVEINLSTSVKALLTS